MGFVSVCLVSVLMDFQSFLAMGGCFVGFFRSIFGYETMFVSFSGPFLSFVVN
jgi:hypothetical protein